MMLLFVNIRFIIMVIIVTAFIMYLVLRKGEQSYCNTDTKVDVIVAAYNEELTILKLISDLYFNDYVEKIIIVNDGSTDRTKEFVRTFMKLNKDKPILFLHKPNGGKATAINYALPYVTTEYVFLTDADIRIRNDNSLGYMIQALKNGGDAVTGIPGSDLTNITFIGKVRASVKVFFAVVRKCAMQVIGGNTICISGSVSMYKTKILQEIKFSTRTNVEDLDITWELVSRGYKVIQSAKAIVYSQEAQTIKDDLKRWRRWISGFAMCMRVHKKLLLTRYGLLLIIPNFLLGVFSGVLVVAPFIIDYKSSLIGLVVWLGLLAFASGYTAHKQDRNYWIIAYAPFTIIVIIIVSIAWLIWGIPTLITGKEYKWTKIKRY